MKIEIFEPSRPPEQVVRLVLAPDETKMDKIVLRAVDADGRKIPGYNILEIDTKTGAMKRRCSCEIPGLAKDSLGRVVIE